MGGKRMLSRYLTWPSVCERHHSVSSFSATLPPFLSAVWFWIDGLGIGEWERKTDSDFHYAGKKRNMGMPSWDKIVFVQGGCMLFFSVNLLVVLSPKCERSHSSSTISRVTSNAWEQRRFSIEIGLWDGLDLIWFWIDGRCYDATDFTLTENWEVYFPFLTFYNPLYAILPSNPTRSWADNIIEGGSNRSENKYCVCLLFAVACRTLVSSS